VKLSVVIPVYNEKNTVLRIMEKVKKVPLEKEIIIVDDGSTDGTREILKTIENRGSKVETTASPDNTCIKVIYHQENEGKGKAIRTALKFVTVDIIVIQDADMEYNPRDYYKLIEPIVSGRAKVVYGSRILKCSRRKSSWRYYWGGRFLTFMANVLYKAKITDEPTCYKVFEASVLKNMNLECRGFEFCPEVTAKVRKQGYGIYEVPIEHNPRSLKEGKKIRNRDGLVALWTLIKYKFKE